MKRLILTICLAIAALVKADAALNPGTDYYIWLNIYEKLLGSNEAGSGPALSAYGKNADGYIFIHLVCNAILILVNLTVAVFQYGLSHKTHWIQHIIHIYRIVIEQRIIHGSYSKEMPNAITI